MFTHESESTHGWYFNCLIEIEGLLKVTGSHVHCIHVEISRKPGHDRDVVTTETLRSAYLIAAISLTLYDLQTTQLLQAFSSGIFVQLCSN